MVLYCLDVGEALQCYRCRPDTLMKMCVETSHLSLGYWKELFQIKCEKATNQGSTHSNFSLPQCLIICYIKISEILFLYCLCTFVDVVIASVLCPIVHLSLLVMVSCFRGFISSTECEHLQGIEGGLLHTYCCKYDLCNH